MFLIALNSVAQKKEISKARDYLKSGKNLEQAEQLMKKLLDDTTHRENKKIWVILFDAQRKQYELGNEKLYLKQKYDTVALFTIASKMFATAESLDSLEMIPDKKGKVNVEYRKKHAEYLSQYRPNLYNGGAFFMSKQKYKEAYMLFSQYIKCAHEPLFDSFKYNETDTLMPVAAYWAVYCGYKLQDPKLTLHHAYLALKDTGHYDLMLQYLAETYKLEKDTTRYFQTIQEGFLKYPKFPFFFPRLIEYYASRGQWKDAMQACDYALEADSTSHLFRLVKSSTLLNMGKYEECIAICNELLAENTHLPDVQLNMGLAYFNQAVELDKATSMSRSRMTKIMDLYKKARPYLEEYRKLAPNRKERWAVPLYTIYLNLNMGKEFDEIDRILKK